jgi:hypothetical protein
MMNPSDEPSAKPGPWERHTRSLAFSIFILALGVLAGVGARDASSHEATVVRQQAPDARQVIALPANQRDMLLNEMRGMLTSMQLIMDAASKLDVTKIRNIAQASGTASIGPADSLFQNVLPADFRKAEVETRSQFDALAQAVRGFTARDTTLAYLARLSQGCVACHGKYRLTVKQ